MTTYELGLLVGCETRFGHATSWDLGEQECQDLPQESSVESANSGWKSNPVSENVNTFFHVIETAVAIEAHTDNSTCMLCKTRPPALMLKVQHYFIVLLNS